MTPDLVAALIGAGAGFITAFVTAYVSFRRLKPEMREIQVRSDKLQADADVIQATAWEKLIKSQEALTGAQQTRLELMNKRLTDLECDLQKMAEARERTAIENTELKIRVRELEQKVSFLEAELEEWKSGRKNKPTGTGTLPE